MHARSHAKQVQSVQLHNSSTSQNAQSTVDTIGVVPAYSSEIASVNSKDLHGVATSKESHWQYTDFVRCEQHETSLKVKECMQQLWSDIIRARHKVKVNIKSNLTSAMVEKSH